MIHPNRNRGKTTGQTIDKQFYGFGVFVMNGAANRVQDREKGLTKSAAKDQIFPVY